MRAGLATRAIASLLGLAFALATASAAAQIPSARWHTQLDAQAAQARPAWQSLLHRGPEQGDSEVQSPWFFWARNGAQDAAAELHASLDALLEDRQIALREESARCAFPARYRFFTELLGEDFARAAPMPACERRSRWLKGLAPEQMWVVFPAGYLNSPSSMFGHTLLRVDSAESRARGPLLAYAANFVANTEEANGAVFAVKGLTGGYMGSYGVLPYYEKVKEYVRMESRDLWEYPLLFSPEEQARVLEHLWELRGADFTYYFFTKNCAYQLLALLQIVRPEADLTSGFKLWAIPTDTLRRLQTQGLLGQPHYRPALQTELQSRAAQLPADTLPLVKELAQGRLAPDSASLQAIDPQVKGRMLDVAHDLIYLRFQAGAAKATLLPQDRRLLAARAGIAALSKFNPALEPATTPDHGHATQRIALELRDDEGAASLSARFRFAYHDLLDDPGGYTQGAEINLGEVEVAQVPAGNSLRLERFTLFEVLSLAPRSALASPISWRVSIGARRPIGASNTPLRGYVEGGPGLAWPLGSGLGYGHWISAFEGGSGLGRGFALRTGPELGLWLPLSRAWRTQANAQYLLPLLGDRRAQLAANLGVQTNLGASWALRGSWQVQQQAQGPLQSRLGLAVLSYF